MLKYDIVPMGKPRMTQRDKWKKRPVVERYWAFRDEVRRQKVELPTNCYHVIFIIPMPKSWSEKKKGDKNFTAHQQKPDKDNLEKALLDAVYADDSVVWDSRVTKIWGWTGCIMIAKIDNWVFKHMELIKEAE